MSYIPFTPYPSYIFGAGSISVLGEKVKELGAKKAMLIFDFGVEAAGIPKKAAASLDAAGVPHICFNGVHADPSVDVVDKCAALGLENGVDLVIGVGGGSSMDTAKCTSILLSGFEGPAAKYVLAVPPVIDTTCPVVLVPTTCGTGSEVTPVAVISRPDMNTKWSVFVNVNLAIVDPELTVTLPLEQTASTGLDALAHCIEGYTNKFRNPVADEMALVGIRKIADNLIRSYEHPGDVEARSEMAMAATMGGLAFKDPLTHVGHAMGDAYGCNFHTPHGQSCVFGLSATVKLVAPILPKEMAKIAEAMRLPLTGRETAEELGTLVEKEIQRYMRVMNVQSQKALGFPRDKVVAMAKEVSENYLSAHCPIEITEERAAELLAYAYDSYQ